MNRSGLDGFAKRLVVKDRNDGATTFGIAELEMRENVAKLEAVSRGIGLFYIGSLRWVNHSATSSRRGTV